MKDIYNIFEEEKLEDLKGVKDIDVDDADIINYLKENPDELKKIIKSIKDSDLSDEEKTEQLKQLNKFTKSVSESYIVEGKGYFAAWMLGGPAGVLGLATIRKVKSYQVTKQVKALKDRAEKETDPDKKKQYEEEYENFRLCSFDKNGNVIIRQKNISKRLKQLKNQDRIKGNFDITKMNELQSDAKDLVKKNKDKDAEAYSDSESKKEEPKEETVKDKSGVEWVKRKKERGEGYTYCRKDDRSVTMSQDEYNKRNASKSKNESQYISLKDYLIESIQ